MSKSTQECYARSVCKIVKFYEKSPDLITEAEFPDRGRCNNLAPFTDKPMYIEGVQGAFRRAKNAAGIKTINEIFRNFRPEHIQLFGKSMLNEHQKVIDAIIKCRIPECGLVIYECVECGEQHLSFRSCGNTVQSCLLRLFRPGLDNNAMN